MGFLGRQFSGNYGKYHTGCSGNEGCQYGSTDDGSWLHRTILAAVSDDIDGNELERGDIDNEEGTHLSRCDSRHFSTVAFGIDFG